MKITEKRIKVSMENQNEQSLIAYLKYIKALLLIIPPGSHK